MVNLTILDTEEGKEELKLHELTMDDLWVKMLEFGRPYLYTSSDGKFHASIEFSTIEYTKLEAKSRFDHKDIKDAMVLAIIKAGEIRRSFK